jgi:hypothetical protein
LVASEKSFDDTSIMERFVYGVSEVTAEEVVKSQVND